MSSLLKISVSFTILLFSLPASGGDPFMLSAGAGEAGTGYVCIMKTGFWSSFHNQALLAKNNSLSFGFNYDNRFFLKELGTRSAALTIPAGSASLGVIYSDFGYSDFKRSMAGLACGVSLSEKISAGVQIDYLSERTGGEYSNKQFLTYEAGMLIVPSDKIMMGIHLFNLLPASTSKSMLPTSLRVGAGTWLNNLLFAGVEAEMSTMSKLNIKTGLEYEAGKNIWLRGGFSTAETSFSFGLGYMIKIALIDICFATHEQLGVTSSISMIFKIH